MLVLRHDRGHESGLRLLASWLLAPGAFGARSDSLRSFWVPDHCYLTAEVQEMSTRVVFSAEPITSRQNVRLLFIKY